MLHIFYHSFFVFFFKELPEELAEMHIPETHSQTWVNIQVMSQDVSF